jgi:hypothetical protein
MMPPDVDDAAAAAASVDLSARMRPVADQGPRGTCLAFAVTAAHELARTGQGHNQGLSVECLYWAAKQRDGDVSEGTSFASAYDALANTGHPREELWPYDPLRDASAPDYAPPPAIVHGNCHRAVLREITPMLEAVRSELAAGCAIAVGIPLWDSFYTPKEGELDLPARSELTGALHVVTVVGYDDRAHRIRIRNSWGVGWGDSGYATLPCGFIGDYVLEAWSIGRLLDQRPIR